MCTLVDNCVGRIVSTLEDSGILEESIIVFTSDHGDQLGEHSMLGKFYNTYEGSLRISLIMRIPETEITTPHIADELVELVDLYPTLCDLTSVPQPEAPWTLAERNLSPLFSEEDCTHRRYVRSMIEHAYMVRSERWKLVEFDNDRSELYDLHRDPAERYNLYDTPECRDIQLELATQIVRHLTICRPSNHYPGKNTFFG